MSHFFISSLYWKKVRDYNEYEIMDELTYYELKTDEVVSSNTKNKRSVWSVTNKPYKIINQLIEPCILAGSEEGDTGHLWVQEKSLGRGCELINILEKILYNQLEE